MGEPVTYLLTAWAAFLAGFIFRSYWPAMIRDDDASEYELPRDDAVHLLINRSKSQ